MAEMNDDELLDALGVSGCVWGGADHNQRIGGGTPAVSVDYDVDVILRLETGNDKVILPRRQSEFS